MSVLGLPTEWVADFRDPDLAFRVSAALLGVGQALTSLEYVAVHRELGAGGLYSWPVLRLFAPRRPAVVARVRDRAFGKVGTITLLVARLVLSCLLVAGSGSAAVALPAIVALAALLLAFNARFPWGREGADDTAVHVSIGLAVFVVCRALDAPSAGLYYIAAYAGLAYVTAGVTKLGEPAWRSGEALLWVVNLQSFGAPWAVDLLAPRPRLRRILSWTVMTCEVLAPLVVLLPAGGIMLALGAAVCFHLVLAFVMGLNTFVWAFASAFPCVLLVWSAVH